MLETIVTVVFLVASLQDGLAVLESPVPDLAQAGDVAIVYRVGGPADDVERWRAIGRGRVVVSGEGPAVVWSSTAPEGSPDLTALRVAVQIPAKRLARGGPSLEAAGAVLLGVPNSDLLAAVDKLIPANERIELAVLALLEQRWAENDTPATARNNSARAPAASTAPAEEGTPAPGPKIQMGENDLVPVHAVIRPANGGAELAPSEPLVLTNSVAGEDPPSIGITARVRAWAAARAERRADTVIAFYADAFVPADGSDRAAWAGTLREAFDGVDSMSIALDDLDAGFLGGVERARVRFTETVTVGGTPRPPQQVQLILVWERDDWFILEETVLDAGG